MTQKAKGPIPADFLDDVTLYSVPKAPAPTDLKLDANEGVAPPSSLYAKLSEPGAENMNRYVSSAKLEAMIAERMGLSAGQVLVTAGADDAIMRACRVYLHARREMILPQPSFDMFTNFTHLAEGYITDVLWKDDDFPTEDVIAAVSENTGIITVTSPNNPTGCVAQAEDIRRIGRAAPDSLLLVDLAYTHFADEDLSKSVFALPNALAAFTFSKAWGMAGLRVGFVAGPEKLVRPLRSAGLPYPASSLSLALAQKWFVDGRDHVAQYVAQAKSERERLEKLLYELGAKPTKSQANFVFARFKDPLWIRDAMGGFGIAVRYIPRREDITGGVRIGCPGNEKDFSRLTHAMKTTLNPQALVFKFDGYEPNDDELQIYKDKYPATIICKKDESVAYAMEILGGKRTWVIADTPEAVADARKFGALPVGVAKPDGDLEIFKKDMYAAGAARVFDTLQQPEEVLP